jgi:predicted kinase
MKTVIICVGISGSGKSTWTTNFIKENPSYLRINRDDIRKTLVGNLDDYYQIPDLKNIEKQINNLEEDIFNSLNWFDYNIIIDNTNLKQSYINRWIDYSQNTNYSIKFKLFDISLEEAKRRVLDRDFNTIYVKDEDISAYHDGVQYIDKQYSDYQQIKQWISNNYKDKIL